MIANLTLTKVLVEKRKDFTGNLNVKKNVKIRDIEEAPLKNIAEEQKALNFKFQFTLNFDPDIAYVEMLGNILYLTDGETIKNVIKEWKKDKKINNQISAAIINRVIKKCDIKALSLCQELNLPPTIPLPIYVKKSDLNKAS